MSAQIVGPVPAQHGERVVDVLLAQAVPDDVGARARLAPAEPLGEHQVGATLGLVCLNSVDLRRPAWHGQLAAARGRARERGVELVGAEAVDDVDERPARSDRRQLARVADEDEPRRRP